MLVIVITCYNYYAYIPQHTSPIPPYYISPNVLSPPEEVRELEQHEVYRIEELRDEVKQVEFETGEVTRQKVALDNEVEDMVGVMS